MLVTPQFHRVHHSIEVRHQDKNFGVVLSVWDRMFGTLHADYDEYPATGVAGLDFPPPRRRAPTAWAADYLRMFIYPFRAIARADTRRTAQGRVAARESAAAIERAKQ